MSAYRPSAVARMVFRLDEGRATADLLAKLEPAGAVSTSAVSTQAPGANSAEQFSSSMEQASVLSKLSQLAGGADPTLIAELNKALAKKRAASAVSSALASFDSRQPDAVAGFSAADARTATLGGIPVLQCAIDRNGFRTMDECTFELSYYEVPFDPRLMRSVAIEIAIGVVPAIEHDAGMHGLRRADGTRHSTQEMAPGFSPQTRFVGFVEEWEIDYSDDIPRVRGRARDVMAIIRDTPLPPGISIDLSKPIEMGVQALLDSFPALRGIPVSFGKARVPVGLGVAVGPVPLAAANKTKLLVNGGKLQRARRMAENTSVWDHITDACVSIGVTPVVRTWGLNIQYARTLYGPKPDVPRMVWGQNLSRLTFRRAMAGFKNPTVEVRSFSGLLKTTIAARYPALPGLNVAVMGTREFVERPMRANRVPPSGANPDETIRVVTVAGVDSLPTLARIARNIYEETARQELEGSFTTRDPSFFGDAFEDATLLDVHAGDPVRIAIDQRRAGDIADSVTLLQGLTPAERYKRLLGIGFDRRVAQTFTALLDAANIQTVFRVRSAHIAFDHDDGLEIEVAFCNYVAVRDDPTSPDAIEADPSDIVADKTRGLTGPTSAAARQASAQKAKARALGQVGSGSGSTVEQQQTETNAAQTSGQLYSDPNAPESQ